MEWSVGKVRVCTLCVLLQEVPGEEEEAAKVEVIEAVEVMDTAPAGRILY